MPGIEDRLAKIKAIQAEAEAKKTAEKETKAKESAEKKAGLEQEKTQVENELAQTTEELQKNESGLAEINAMDLSALDAESRAAIESEMVGIKEEMDNLSGKVAELTKRKQEIDEELKGVTGETEKTFDNGVTELKADAAAVEKTENTEQDPIEMEIQRPLNPEEQQDLDHFSKKLEQIQLTPEKLALIHDYNEKVKNLPPGSHVVIPPREGELGEEWQLTKKAHFYRIKDAAGPIYLMDKSFGETEHDILSEEGELEAMLHYYDGLLGRPHFSDELTNKRIEAVQKQLKFIQEERRIQPKRGSELKGLLDELEDLRHTIRAEAIRKGQELKTKVWSDKILPKEKRADYRRKEGKNELQTKYTQELRKLLDQIERVLES